MIIVRIVKVVCTRERRRDFGGSLSTIDDSSSRNCVKDELSVTSSYWMRVIIGRFDQ